MPQAPALSQSLSAPMPRSEVLVLGAGMVGIGTALALQSRGHAVTVVDRHAVAGRETSLGNAGVIQGEAMEPYAMPRDLGSLLRYGLGMGNDLRWHLRDLPAAAPALWAYFKASAPDKHARISRIYSQLIARGVADHAAYIAAANCGELVRTTGLGEIYRTSKAYEKAAGKALQMRDRYGLSLRLLTQTELQREEPALTCPRGDAPIRNAQAPTIAGAILWPDSWSTSDPAALTAAYADLFKARGGDIVQGDAMSLRAHKAGWQMDSATGRLSGSDVVIALGPWSPDLLRAMGYEIQMLWKRGYHQHYATAQALTRPYLDAENGFVMSSMSQGLRITTGAEIVRRDAPADLRQLRHARHAAGELLEISADAPTSAPWIGHRPCLARMLPMVGRAPARSGGAHKGLWFNFGHGHQGLTLGPTTGHLLADMFEGEQTELSRALAP